MFLHLFLWCRNWWPERVNDIKKTLMNLPGASADPAVRLSSRCPVWCAAHHPVCRLGVPSIIQRLRQ